MRLHLLLPESYVRDDEQVEPKPGGVPAEQVVAALTAAVPEEVGCWRGEPYGPNQIPQDHHVSRALYCVTPSRQIVEYFQQSGYDLLVSHHPFPVNVPQVILHTALDCCAGGLNDMWKDALGLRNPRHFWKELGWAGEVGPMSFEDLCAACESFMDGTILGQKGCSLDQVNSVVICTGLGGAVVDKALASGADCYILGEAMQDLSRSGFQAYIECGHTNTEWIGVFKIREVLEPMGIVVDLVPREMDVFRGEIWAAPKAPEPLDGGGWGAEGWAANNGWSYGEEDLGFDDLNSEEIIAAAYVLFLLREGVDVYRAISLGSDVDPWELIEHEAFMGFYELGEWMNDPRLNAVVTDLFGMQ